MNILEEEVKFGKYKGTTWGNLIYSDSRYVSWVIDNVNHSSLSEEDKDELYEALDESGFNWTRDDG